MAAHPLIVSGYIIGDRLGFGAQGEVFSGSSAATGERVALKVIKRSTIVSAGEEQGHVASEITQRQAISTSDAADRHLAA